MTVFSVQEFPGSSNFRTAPHLGLNNSLQGWWERTVQEAPGIAPSVAEFSVLKLEDLKKREEAGEETHPDVLL